MDGWMGGERERWMEVVLKPLKFLESFEQQIDWADWIL